MKIKCPICGTEYEETTVRFCKRCMYSIGSDRYLTDLLNHPSEDDLKIYNEGIEEYRALWEERNPEKTRIVSGLMEMVEVEGGTFMMGSNEGKNSWEQPVHKVSLSSFLISNCAVTQELWESVMGSNPSSLFKGNRKPVVDISWLDAIAFCNKLSEKMGLTSAYCIDKNRPDPTYRRSPFAGEDPWFVTLDFNSNGYRLPTEAEWEFAARGGSKSKGYTYSGSNNLNEVGWYSVYDSSENLTTEEGTSDVGKKQSNEIGLYDMSGNVWEWCWDWFDQYTSASQINPKGASSGHSRVGRGGGWDGASVDCRVSKRASFSSGFSLNNLGLRVSRSKN